MILVHQKWKGISANACCCGLWFLFVCSYSRFALRLVTLAIGLLFVCKKEKKRGTWFSLIIFDREEEEEESYKIYLLYKREVIGNRLPRPTLFLMKVNVFCVGNGVAGLVSTFFLFPPPIFLWENEKNTQYREKKGKKVNRFNSRPIELMEPERVHQGGKFPLFMQRIYRCRWEGSGSNDEASSSLTQRLIPTNRQYRCKWQQRRVSIVL
jgi:hypothetical protein